MCFFIIHVPHNWMETAILHLIGTRAVCKQLHSLCNNTRVGILVSLTTSIDNGLPNLVNHLTGVYSTVRWNFVHTSPSSKWKSSKGWRIVPLPLSKLLINIGCSWVSNSSVLVYSFFIGPISCLQTFVFLKIGRKVAIFFLRSFGTSISRCMLQKTRLNLSRH